jgi:hypothetical protein
MQFGNRLAVLRDDKDLARGRHLVHQGEAAGLEFGGLDGLHGCVPWSIDMTMIMTMVGCKDKEGSGGKLQYG